MSKNSSDMIGRLLEMHWNIPLTSIINFNMFFNKNCLKLRTMKTRLSSVLPLLQQNRGRVTSAYMQGIESKNSINWFQLAGQLKLLSRRSPYPLRHQWLHIRNYVVIVRKFYMLPLLGWICRHDHFSDPTIGCSVGAWKWSQQACVLRRKQCMQMAECWKNVSILVFYDISIWKAVYYRIWVVSVTECCFRSNFNETKR